MFEVSDSGLALVLVVWCVVAWGLWPLLRTKCAAAVPAFALLNMTTQAIASAFWGLTLGTLVAPSKGEAFTSALVRLFHERLNIRDGAVFLGGFCLGHGDHISALSMQHLPAGVVYPVYAGLIVAGGGGLNYAQAPPSNPPLLFAGFALILCAIVLLALAERRHHAEQSPEHEAALDYSRFEAQLGAAAAPTAINGGAPGLLDGGETIPRSTSGLSSFTWAPPLEAAARGKVLSPDRALLVTLAGAACACVWSPLATFGTGGVDRNVEKDTYICLFVFAMGQLLALPSVAVIAGRLGGTGVMSPCHQLNRSQIGWGLVCGLSVSSGYLAFFLGSQAASPTVVFGIAHCNPLVALLIEIVWVGSFRGASQRVRVDLALCVTLYCAAIGLLMLSNSV